MQIPFIVLLKLSLWHFIYQIDDVYKILSKMRKLCFGKFYVNDLRGLKYLIMLEVQRFLS